MLELLKKIFTIETEQQRVEKYLSKSVDISDLEARMKSIKEAENTNQSHISHRRY
ncbi:MAG: DUF3563 family protein [Candidatus Sericytochromatia bacterium]|nr:DUF3563 family protein [Candidatus Sericytochromatia bacterium]